jgi:hypothetical protein
MRLGNLPAWIFVLAIGLGAPVIASQRPEPSGKRSFTPPANGHLTDEHVRMYIAVRRAATALPDPAGAASGSEEAVEQIAKGSAVELSAARRLGVDADEYRWVRARIIEASAPAGATADNPLLATIEAQAKAGATRVRDETGGRPDAVQPVDAAAIAWNRGFLGKYRAELDALAMRGR